MKFGIYYSNNNISISSCTKFSLNFRHVLNFQGVEKGCIGNEWVKAIFTILYHLCNVKIKKNTDGGVLLLVTKSYTSQVDVFHVSQIVQWYRIAQSIKCLVNYMYNWLNLMNFPCKIFFLKQKLPSGLVLEIVRWSRDAH